MKYQKNALAKAAWGRFSGRHLIGEEGHEGLLRERQGP